MTATDGALAMARVAAQAAADKQARDILLVDVSDRLVITDVFVIVTGTNERQVGSIVDAVEEKMREAGTTLWLVGMNPGVFTVVQKSLLGERLGRERMFFSLEQAVEKYERDYSIHV